MTKSKTLTFVTPDNVPPVVAAAQLVLRMFDRTKTSNWSDLVATQHVTPTITLTPDQHQLLTRWSEILPYLHRLPRVSVFGCTVCDRYAFVDNKPIPKKCPFTLGCAGETVKATTQNRKPSAPTT